MLTIRNLTKSFAGTPLFQNAKMTINWGERVALVGPNGAGKSTLFRIILGEDEADEGEVDRDEYAVCGFLSQEAGDPGDQTVLEIAMGVNPELIKAMRLMREHEAKGTQSSAEFAEAQDKFDALSGYQVEPKAKQILRGLAFKDDDFERPAKEFSGGWVMRAHLARLLTMEPDLLMLDEPTNHLDLMSLLWFENYLKNYPGAILLISHDRDFMDEIIETVYEISEQKLHHYEGNYSAFTIEKEKRYEQAVSRYRNQKKNIDHIQEFVNRFRGVGSKASQVQSKIKQIEKLSKDLVKPIAPRKLLKFKFPQPERSNQKVIELQKVNKTYGDKVIYDKLDLTIERGDRIVLVGPNGAGKSTLIKLLAGVEQPTSGECKPGYLTKIGYFSQQRTEGLNENNSVLEEVMGVCPDLREDEARAILGSFLFRRADVEKRVRVLSGGEKSRLSLVKFLVNPPNLLLMDEPTTHLDIQSVDALVEALKSFQGTLVFISHDVHFIRSLAEKTLHIAAGEINAYAGGYDYFLEKSGLGNARAALTATTLSDERA